MATTESRVSTKICPNCTAEVPAVANLCKQCFHDFHTVQPKKRSSVEGLIWTLLVMAFASSLVAILAFSHRASLYQTSDVTVDEETKSVVFVTTTTSGPQTNRIKFEDISAIESVTNASPYPFEIAVLTVNGKRYIYAQGSEPLTIKGQDLADMTGKPVIERNEYAGGDAIKKNEPE